MKIQKSNYNHLIHTIGKLLTESRTTVAKHINTVLLKTYWQIGHYIVEFEQGGDFRAEYGSELLQQLAKDLSLKFGKGFSRSNLTYMRKFYIKFPNFQISETASHKLTWSHYFEILKADSDLEIGFI